MKTYPNLGTMPGTSGAPFQIVADTELARVGFRPIGDNHFRIRVEPKPGKTLSGFEYWKQPSYSQNRFSNVVEGEAAAETSLDLAIANVTPAPKGLAVFPIIGTMPGTTGSTFNAVYGGSVRTVGYRDIGGGQFRIRVVPAEGFTIALPGWNQPTPEQNRYSKVVTGEEAAVAAIHEAINATALVAAPAPAPAPEPEEDIYDSLDFYKEGEMGGTEAGSVFDVVFENELGKVGFREYEPGQYRVRVQLKEAGTELELDGWKEPTDEQNRYSLEVSKEELNDALNTAAFALEAEEFPEVLPCECDACNEPKEGSTPAITSGFAETTATRDPDGTVRVNVNLTLTINLK